MSKLVRLTAIAAMASISAMLGGANAQIEFSKHDIYFELNATDGDVGLHGILDGDSRAWAKITGPGGTFDVIRAISNQDSPEFGMTELFFESNEPPLSERSFQELITLFPPGTYRFAGRTTANEVLFGSDRLSARMPCPPVVSVATNNKGEVTISWQLRAGRYNPDTAVCAASNPVAAAFVQAFFSIENEETGFSRSFSVDLSPTTTEVEVPEEIFEGVDLDAVDAKAEVIVVAPDSNRTAIEMEVEL